MSNKELSWSQTRQLVLKELQTGPKTVRQLRAAIPTRQEYVSNAVTKCVEAGYVRNIGGAGRGKIAIWELDVEKWQEVRRV